MPLAVSPSLELPRAADAWAAGESCGIGGWFLDPSSKRKFWFSLQLSRGDFPTHWELNATSMQSYITSLEALAQLALFVAQHDVVNLRGKGLTIQQASDNTAAEGALNKMFSTASPMKYILQITAARGTAIGCNLNVSHIPGPDNVEADAASRAINLHWSDSACRVHLKIENLLEIKPLSRACPSSIAWPPTLNAIIPEQSRGRV